MNVEELEERILRLEANQGNFPARWALGGGNGGGNSGVIFGHIKATLDCNASTVAESFGGKFYDVWEHIGATTDIGAVYGWMWSPDNKYGSARWVVVFKACDPCPENPTTVDCAGGQCSYVWDEDLNPPAWRPPGPDEPGLPQCPDGCFCPPPVFINRAGHFDGEIFFLNCGTGPPPAGFNANGSKIGGDDEGGDGGFGLMVDPGGPSGGGL